jgi:hypothetical protein
MSFRLEGGIMTMPTLDWRVRSAFRATPEAEARLLLLIDAFSRTRRGPRNLQGRIKLAKLDFLLRYPYYAARLLARVHASEEEISDFTNEASPLEQRMVRYRYGPWDPAYYALLGSLIGRGLVEVVPFPSGLGYRTTERGRQLAAELGEDDSHMPVKRRAELLRRRLDKSGTTLKNLIYQEVPEVSKARWHTHL